MLRHALEVESRPHISRQIRYLSQCTLCTNSAMVPHTHSPMHTDTFTDTQIPTQTHTCKKNAKKQLHGNLHTYCTAHDLVTHAGFPFGTVSHRVIRKLQWKTLQSLACRQPLTDKHTCAHTQTHTFIYTEDS